MCSQCPATRAALDQLAAKARDHAKPLLARTRSNLDRGVDRDLQLMLIAGEVRDALAAGRVTHERVGLEIAWLLTRWPAEDRVPQ